MKKLLTFLFGDLGICISGAVCTGLFAVVLPLFLYGIQEALVIKILTWIFAFPFVIGAGLSAFYCAGTIFVKAHNAQSKVKKALYIIFALLILAAISTILILNLV